MTLQPFYTQDNLFSISGTLQWVGDILAAEFVVKGPLKNIRGLLTSGKATSRADGLWKTTCFEWFLKPLSGEAYWEANFSPTGQWNLYLLEGYRKNLVQEERAKISQLVPKCFSTEWHLKTQIDFSRIALPPKTKFKAHASAVIETVDDKKNYWSFTHTQNQPDFHHPDHFILEIQKES